MPGAAKTGIRPTQTYLRLFLPFAAVLVTAMIAAWWIAAGLLFATLERRLDEQLGHAVDVLGTGSIPPTADLLTRLGDLLRADVAFLAADGSAPLSTAPPVAAIGAAVLADLLARSAGDAAAVTADAGDYRVVLERATRDPRFVAVVAWASLADVRAAARSAALWLALATALATVALGAAGYHLLRRITATIGKLSRMAERIAEGERDVQVSVDVPDEMGTLTAALNGMAKRLAAYEAELAEQTRLSALGEMSARIAHEIRNPLTAIALKLELLAESVQGEAAAEVRALLKEIERLDLIVTSTLSVARPQRVDARPMDLNTIVEEVGALVTAQLAHQGVMLRMRLQPLPTTPLDASRVKQVLFNLINNAAAAMPDGGALQIATAAADGAVVLHVEDSGPGVAEAQPLFESTSASGRFKLGLGLSLCRELVELHGGSIAASRSPELGGARFSVIFPVPIIAAAGHRDS
jgi:signal transduction histidine kinase